METRLKKLEKELAEVRAKKEVLNKKEKKLSEDIQLLEATQMKKMLADYNLTIPELEKFLKQKNEEEKAQETTNIPYSNNMSTSTGQ